MSPYRYPTPINEMIVGYLPTSYCDWPGKISSVVFLHGCNLYCPTCHNWEIAHPNKPNTYQDLDHILSDIFEHKKWLDGITISGGEVLVHQNLYELIYQFYKICDLPIKLDTNGMDPEALDEVLSSGWINTVAMDIKAPWEKYPYVTGCKQKDPEYFKHTIEKSISLVQTYPKVKLYFRTTKVPHIDNEEDLQKIKTIIPFGYAHHWQQYRPTEYHQTERTFPNGNASDPEA